MRGHLRGLRGALSSVPRQTVAVCDPAAHSAHSAPPVAWALHFPMTHSKHAVAPTSARAGNRRFGLLRARRAHTKAPYKPDLLWETLRALNRPGRARTVEVGRVGDGRRLRACRALRARLAARLDVGKLAQHAAFAGRRPDLGLYPIVTSQHISTTLYQVSDHIQ